MNKFKAPGILYMPGTEHFLMPFWNWMAKNGQ
jgi:hypothetical protein